MINCYGSKIKLIKWSGSLIWTRIDVLRESGNTAFFILLYFSLSPYLPRNDTQKWTPPSSADPTSQNRSKCKCPEMEKMLRCWGFTLYFETNSFRCMQCAQIEHFDRMANVLSPVQTRRWWPWAPRVFGTTSCTWCETSSSASWAPSRLNTVPSCPPCSRRWRRASPSTAAEMKSDHTCSAVDQIVRGRWKCVKTWLSNSDGYTGNSS